ncbi:transposase, partial [uncultured Desulfobacter sp.]|uniref:IS66 family transposase n=1 Tax=uncultured Desulfobacter sp. TaxID=240139 RepID=UPI00259B6605
VMLLRRFILYQYYHGHVTQPILLEQLHDIGFDISSGQLNNIIIENHDGFHNEKDAILDIGLSVSTHINVDDTTARHEGQNGYCTHIGNEFFATFHSTDSKSRINFLKLLQAGRTDYIINASALSYMISQGLPQDSLTLVTSKLLTVCEDDIAWDEFVKSLGIEKPLHIKIITEGALIGSLIEHGFNTDMVIVSDDAGQFNVLIHALCWIHAERLINKLIGLTDEQKEAVKSIRSDIWDLYASLKNFKEQPDDRKKADIEAQFDKIFTQKTCFASLNNALKRIYRNKPELLRVLDFPDTPLHNNTSENQ